MKVHENLLANIPVGVGEVILHSYTLREIFEIGVDNYFQKVGILLFDFTDLPFMDDPEIQDFTDYRLLLLISEHNEGFRKSFLEALDFFTKSEFTYYRGFFVNIKKQVVLEESNFQEIRKTISTMHWIPEPKRYTYANMKAKAIQQKLEENAKEVARLKKKRGDSPPELYDYVSSFALHSKIYNLFNVWDLTFYQFQDQLLRLEGEDDYLLSYSAIFAGADPKKITIKHWTSKIKINN